MRPGHALLTVQEIGDYLISLGLAKFKLPERVEAIDAFPLTRVGKVDKGRSASRSPTRWPRNGSRDAEACASA